MFASLILFWLLACGSGYTEEPADNSDPLCSGCGQNAYCAWPGHCECIDDDYEKNEDGLGCKPKPDRHLCPKDTKSSDITVPVDCCEGYERQSPTEPCLRKAVEYECTRLVRVAMNIVDIDIRTLWNIEALDTMPDFRMEMRRECCEGYERKSKSDPTCVPIASKGDYAEEHSSESKAVDELSKELPSKEDGEEQMSTTWQTMVSQKLNLTVPEFEPINLDEKKPSKGNDPNLCFRELKSTLTPEWQMIKDYFDKLNLTFPSDMFKKIETYCCEGYQLDTESGLCQPKCEPKCEPNCRCVEPGKCERPKEEPQLKPSVVCCSPHDQCECEPGYVWNQNTRLCEAICAKACPAHSSCARPGQCQCHEGYVLSSDAMSCQPICDGITPEHSTCIYPGLWECDLGYVKLPNVFGEGFTCEPHCIQSCSTYGKCVAPNVCECLPGYESFPSGFNRRYNVQIESCVRTRKHDEADSTAQKSSTLSTTTP